MRKQKFREGEWFAQGHTAELLLGVPIMDCQPPALGRDKTHLLA